MTDPKTATKAKAVSKSADTKTASAPAAAKKVKSEKPESSKAAKKSAAPAVEKQTKAQATAVKLTPEEHYRMVQTAAYYIAERDGFGGNSSDYWIAAELEIADRLS